MKVKKHRGKKNINNQVAGKAFKERTNERNSKKRRTNRDIENLVRSEKLKTRRNGTTVAREKIGDRRKKREDGRTSMARRYAEKKSMVRAK